MNYAYVDGNITQKLPGKDTTYYNLVRRPKHNVHVFAGYQVNKDLFISSSLQFTGKRIDNYFDPISFIPSQVDLKAYALLNMYAEYNFLKKKLNIFVDAKNLTGKKNYYEVFGYNVQSFNVTAGLRFQL
jgi:vitamin B12 transporter